MKLEKGVNTDNHDVSKDSEWTNVILYPWHLKAIYWARLIAILTSCFVLLCFSLCLILQLEFDPWAHGRPWASLEDAFKIQQPLAPGIFLVFGSQDWRHFLQSRSKLPSFSRFDGPGQPYFDVQHSWCGDSEWRPAAFNVLGLVGEESIQEINLFHFFELFSNVTGHHILWSRDIIKL